MKSKRMSTVEKVQMEKKDDPIASLSSLLIRHERAVAQLMAFSGWSRPWVENLWVYCKSMKPLHSDIIPRNDFIREMVSLFGMTSSLFIDRTFEVFRRFSPDNHLRPECMFKGITRLVTSDIDIKIDYVFDMYDFNFDGFISFDELSTSLRGSLLEEDFEAREEGSREIFDLVKKFLDINSDGSISHLEFKTRVKQDTLLLEILGPCLPSPSSRELFINLITPEKISPMDLQHKLDDRKVQALQSRGTPKTKSNQYYPILIVMPSKEDMKSKSKR